jgi:hypothetical protein
MVSKKIEFFVIETGPVQGLDRQVVAAHRQQQHSGSLPITEPHGCPVHEERHDREPIHRYSAFAARAAIFARE